MTGGPPSITGTLLLTLQGSREPRRLARGAAVTLGRGRDSDWVLPDPSPEPTLSRKHCRIALGPSGPIVVDLNSANGTRLNGRPVPPQIPTPLETNDVLELGPHRVHVTMEVEAPVKGPAFAAVSGAPSSVDPLGGVPDPIGSGLAPPPAPSPSHGFTVGPRPSIDDIFRDWGQTGARASPPPPLSPPSLADDPLQGPFGEPPAPLPSVRPAGTESPPAATPGPPQLEALLPRSPPPSPRQAPPARPPGADGDPFGLAELGSLAPRPTADPLATPSPPSAAAARSRRPADPIAAPARSPVPGSPDALPPGTAAAAVSPGPARSAVPPRAERATEDVGLLAAFLAGAGLPRTALDGADPEAAMREAGRVFGRLAEALRELLRVRAMIKDHARLERTQIGAALNNPLKLSVNAREATEALLRRRGEGYLAPLEAVEASLADLKAHELALLEGLRSALDDSLKSFDPDALAAELEAEGALANLLQGGRRARLWELYRERYAEIAKGARDRFMGRFDDAFRDAYARKSAEVAGAALAPTGGPRATPRTPPA